MERNFEHLTQFAGLALGLLLIVRLLLLHLQRTYLIFSVFVIADLIGSALWMLRSWGGSPLSTIDYRLLWLTDRVVVWGLLLWTVVALLDAVLARYPGIATLSRKTLNFCFLGAVVIAALSAFPEYAASETAHKTISWKAHLVIAGLVAERVVFSIALLAMLAILAFLLWFPVEIPRNLVVFTTGFLIYFSVMNFALLARSFWSSDILPYASVAGSLVSVVCFAYWGLSISKRGEIASAGLYLNREAKQQERLMQRLELLNDSLLRAARR